MGACVDKSYRYQPMGVDGVVLLTIRLKREIVHAERQRVEITQELISLRDH